MPRLRVQATKGWDMGGGTVVRVIFFTFFLLKKPRFDAFWEAFLTVILYNNNKNTYTGSFQPYAI